MKFKRFRCEIQKEANMLAMQICEFSLTLHSFNTAFLSGIQNKVVNHIPAEYLEATIHLLEYVKLTIFQCNLNQYSCPSWDYKNICPHAKSFPVQLRNWHYSSHIIDLNQSMCTLLISIQYHMALYTKEVKPQYNTTYKNLRYVHHQTGVKNKCNSSLHTVYPRL